MFLRNSVNSFTVHTQHQAIVDFRSALRTDEDHAKWTGIPANDIYGASNSNGHEVAFYTIDSRHALVRDRHHVVDDSPAVGHATSG